MKKKVMLCFGTRPEAIKMAPVYLSLRDRLETFEPVCCVTGQHRELLDQALRSFGIAPEFDLKLMRSGQDLSDLTSAVLGAVRAVLRDVTPDLVLVQGDTTTTMAASLASFYAGVPVGHVEAGLRTRNVTSPFPEEFNRRLTGAMAHYHFAPTEGSRSNLLREGCDPARVLVTGNTGIDALHRTLAAIESDPAIRARIESELDRDFGFDWKGERFVLVTGHRRENLGHGIRQLCEAIARLSQAFPRVHFVYAMHLNPQARRPALALLGARTNVHLAEPLAYEHFLHALKHCDLVLTDSGGIQEEAPSLGKPVLVTRDTTERPEGVAAGTVRLVGCSRDSIYHGVAELLSDSGLHRRMSRAHNPYGDGTAAARIADFLARQ